MGRLIAQRACRPGGHAVPVLSREYGYDHAGNVRHVTDHSGNTRHYRYDPLGQLIEAHREVFAFDPAHNMLDGTDEPILNNRVTQSGDWRYLYDTHGNVVEKIIGPQLHMRFDYCTRHRMERARINGPAGQTTVEYGYDALGRRVFKRDAANTTLFLFGSPTVFWARSRIVAASITCTNTKVSCRSRRSRRIMERAARPRDGLRSQASTRIRPVRLMNLRARTAQCNGPPLTARGAVRSIPAVRTMLGSHCIYRDNIGQHARSASVNIRHPISGAISRANVRVRPSPRFVAICQI